MSGMRLDYGAAHEAAGRLAAAQTSIARHLSALESAASALSGGWSGDARAAYASAQRDWSDGMTRMNALLDNARSILDEWVGETETLDGDLARGWPA